MKFVLQVVAVAVVSLILQYFLPWWTMAIGACVIGYAFGTNGYSAFASGFFGVALLWLGMALYIDSASSAILTQKINRLLPVNAFVLTGLIGGLVGGLASMTGSLLRGNAKHIGT